MDRILYEATKNELKLLYLFTFRCRAKYRLTDLPFVSQFFLLQIPFEEWDLLMIFPGYSILKYHYSTKGNE